MGIMSEFGNLFDGGSSLSKSSEYGSNIGSFFHRNDSEFIFFIDPDEEGLVFVVVDTPSRRPVSVKITCISRSSITFLTEACLWRVVLS